MTEPTPPPPGIARLPAGLLGVTATPHPDAGFIPLAPAVALPDHFQGTVLPTDAALPMATLVVRIVDREPQCVQLTLTRQDENVRPPPAHARPITGAVLRRVRVHELVREATAAATIRYTRQRPDDERANEPFNIDGEPAWEDREVWPLQEDWEAGRLFVANGARQPRRGIPITDDDLRHVADVYRASMAEGRPPTLTVAETMHVARPTASRWIARARARGFLGPARRGAAGELPTTPSEA